MLIEDVSIKSVGGHGIFNSGAYDHNAIEVNGIIEAKSQYYSGVTSDAAYTTVNVTETGDIVGYNAITVDGDNATISNDGHLNAYSVGIYVDGIGSKITNTGSIVAGSNYTEVYTGTAVYIDEGSTFNFANTGNVSATYGVTIKSSEGVITNSELAGIHGTHIAIQIDNLSGQSVEIINEDACGITSDGFAIRGSDGSERVTNAGYMKGKISLGAGNDSFDNQDGLIDHAIDGGTGDDIYILGSASDQIVDGAGKDSVHTEFTSSLKSYSTIENLKLLGSGNISGTGNALTNVIIGNDGNNILNGGPDSVVDTLIGGKGNDTYVLGSGSDKVTDTAGTDTITSTIGRSMAYYGLIENLKLLGTGNISGTGNSLANVIIGNSGNNILNGGVETTAVIDTLNGGAGNDTYVLGSGADKVIDSAGYRHDHLSGVSATSPPLQRSKTSSFWVSPISAA
ncbi:hypothetical protein LP421_30425 (plasmid) [Rhizobium sp. RCAM05350]|nr:hypothetical protein LP421_30425 [Rhizobium sp. RCAM05350]